MATQESQCSFSNRASTVFDAFLKAVDNYGLPSRVRCDKGERTQLFQSSCYHTLCVGLVEEQ